MLAVTAHAVCRVPASWLQDRGTTGLNQYANRWDAPMERSFAENAALTAALVRDRPIYLFVPSLHYRFLPYDPVRL